MKQAAQISNFAFTPTYSLDIDSFEKWSFYFDFLYASTKWIYP